MTHCIRHHQSLRVIFATLDDIDYSLIAKNSSMLPFSIFLHSRSNYRSSIERIWLEDLTYRVHDGVRDICFIETTIDGNRSLIAFVYISPGTTTIIELHHFFEFNLMAYSPKEVAIFDVVKSKGYNSIPVVLGGHLNVNLSRTECTQILEFMHDTFDLQLNNDPSVSTTRDKKTCVDAVFTRHVEHLHTVYYVSYFGYRRPLLSIANVPTWWYVLCQKTCSWSNVFSSRERLIISILF